MGGRQEFQQLLAKCRVRHATHHASDVCDPSVAPSNDAPSSFNVGNRVVTSTAVDDTGNGSSCSSTLAVTDTTPPRIVASVTPAVLWSPDHKLVTIVATVSVSDGCDPMPRFVLTSITSNEPDQGLGDGDTKNDIRGASFGTADTQFQLRAERAGQGTGRVYTIRYTAIDGSGNTADAVTQVTVPLTSS